MTEEKRILKSEHGVLSCSYPTGDNKPLWHFREGFAPVPITKTEFKRDVVNQMFGLNSQIINFIGIDEFWDRYSKPIAEQKVHSNDK